MNLEELLGKIEADDIKEAIVDMINAEKERGKESYRKKDSEVLKYKSITKSLGYDPETHGDVDTWLESVKNEKKTVTDSKLTIAQLNEKLDEMKANWETEKENNRTIQQKAKENKLSAELTGKIGNMFYGSNYMIKDLISSGRADLSENGVTIDGLSIDEAIMKIQAENKDMLRLNQKGGTGDNGGSESPASDESSIVAQIKNKMK